MSEEAKTRSEWERERAAELAQRDALKLAEKAAALEFDLKAVRVERDELKTRIPEGGLVLTKADAERWARYQTLGKPEELEQARTAGAEAQTRLAQRERQDGIRRAAETAGFRPALLERLAPQDAQFDVRNVDVDGKATPTAYLKLADGTERSLTDWAAAEPDLLPALQVTPAPAPLPAGIAFPAQVLAPTTKPVTTADIGKRLIESGEYSV